MSVILYPGIEELDKNGLCYSLYIQLYNNFFQAQTKKDKDNPYGIEEGDETSIRLRNTAYNFADAIAGAIENGDSGIGGILLDYVKIAGGNMTGLLTANYGFEAGIQNHLLLKTFKTQYFDTNDLIYKERFGIRFTGDVEIGGDNLLIGGKKILSYDSIRNEVILSGASLNLETQFINTKGEIKLFDGIDEKIVLNKYGIKVDGNTVYHSGNSNRATISWQMHDSYVEGKLTVKGISILSGQLKAYNGFELGSKDTIFMFSDNDKVTYKRNLSFEKGFGIVLKNNLILSNINDTDIQLNSAGGDLLLGNDNTNKLRILSNVTDVNGQYVLLSKFGSAYFPESLTVRHNFGKMLLSTYRLPESEGIIIHELLKFGSDDGPHLQKKHNGISIHTSFDIIENGSKKQVNNSIIFIHGLSGSKYKPLDKLSATSYINTDADFFSFDKPVESENYIGINNSLTRLTSNSLFFSDKKYLLSSIDGVKHFGNAYFIDDIGSELFSSGFAGSGWSINKNEVTGNHSATFDELTIRKKMRIYELEVQKISATNGSLWISDNCQGDTVIKL